METVKARLGVSPSTQHPAQQLDFIRLGHIPRGVVSKLKSHEVKCKLWCTTPKHRHFQTAANLSAEKNSNPRADLKQSEIGLDGSEITVNTLKM